MNIETRARYWEDWQSRIFELYGDVWDALTEDFAPRKYHNGHIVPADKDTEAVREMYDMLEHLNSYVEGKAKAAHAETVAVEDAWDMFRAWELGLCPRVMIQYRDAPVRKVNDAGYTATWAAIASHLTQSEMNKEDTMLAVLACKMSRQEAK